MTLPFGTRVTLNTHTHPVGVIVGLGRSAAESYQLVWDGEPPDLRPWYFRPELTVVPSPADVALSEIAALLGLPPDAEPKVVVEVFRRGALREAMRPPMEIKITTEGEARMVMESAFARTLRVVADLNPNGQDFVWASVNEDGTVQGMPRVVRQAPRHHDRGRPPRYVVGPDPALLVERP